MPNSSVPVLPKSSAASQPRSRQGERGYTPNRDLSANHDQNRELPGRVSPSRLPKDDLPAVPSRGGLAALL